MEKNLINNIIDLRAAVSFLGEKKAWWNSNFYESSSKDFLTYIFPKSKNTQFSCSNISTRNFIDKEVGANYFHLFRLTISMEELISSTEKKTTIIDIKSEENALKILTELAYNSSTDGNSGPKNIGSVDQMNIEILKVFAAEYLNAFKNDYKVHPYLN